MTTDSTVFRCVVSNSRSISTKLYSTAHGVSRLCQNSSSKKKEDKKICLNIAHVCACGGFYSCRLPPCRITTALLFYCYSNSKIKTLIDVCSSFEPTGWFALSLFLSLYLYLSFSIALNSIVKKSLFNTSLSHHKYFNCFH